LSSPAIGPWSYDQRVHAIRHERATARAWRFTATASWFAALGALIVLGFFALAGLR